MFTQIEIKYFIGSYIIFNIGMIYKKVYNILLRKFHLSSHVECSNRKESCPISLV